MKYRVTSLFPCFYCLTPTLIASLEPVRFVRKLRNTFYKIGHPLTLECTFTGSQRIYVSWMKDGKPIWASYKYNVKTTNFSSTLDVLNSDRRDAVGKYSCEISNSEGTDICHAMVKIGKATNICTLLPSNVRNHESPAEQSPHVNIHLLSVTNYATNITIASCRTRELY